MKRATSVIVFLSLMWVIGCERGKVDDLAVARQELQEHAYGAAEIRLERLIAKRPQNVEAQCLLAVVYNRQNRTQKLEAAVGKLRELGKPAMDKLVSIMMYEQNMAEDMVKVLTLAGEPAIDTLVPVLGNATEYVRESAISILTKIGAPAAERLKEALDSPDALTRAGAARSLGDIGDKTAIKPLVRKLEDASPYVKTEAAIALYKLGDKSHVDMITSGLGVELIPARRAAAIAIRDVVEKPAFEPLLKATKDGDKQVRTAAVRALGKVKDTRVIAPLIEAIRAKDDIIRSAAADALKETGELAVMPLVDLIKQEQDAGTLQRAIQALGDLGDKRAVGALEKVYAESKLPLVKQEAAIALNKIE